MTNLVANLPINSVSFGNVSVTLLRAAFEKGLSSTIFPIGGVDVSSYTFDETFGKWLEKGINFSYEKHSRSNPVLKLWHLNGSLESFSSDQILLTFHELDQLTASEVNAIKNQKLVLVTSEYTKRVCLDYGLTNVEVIKLGFDKWSFRRRDKSYFNDGRITFGISGKYEPVRKRHEKTIRAWIKRFGNDRRYFLQCSLFNPFRKLEELKQDWFNLVDGKKPFNVEFLSPIEKNVDYNEFLNSNDIIVDMGTESWGLPLFQSLAIGKHGVALDAAGHKSFANNQNCVLVQPNAKIPAYDGFFFHPGAPFNQGNVFDFEEEAFIHACEESIKRVESNKVNGEGMKLQETHSADKSLGEILKFL